MFKNLQAKFDGRTELPIEIEDICTALVEMGYQDEIRVVPEEMDLGQLLGTYVQFTEPGLSMYGEPQLVSLIVYPSNIDDPHLQRIICAKELVHVCDAHVSRTNSPSDISELAHVLSERTAIGDEPKMTMKVAADVLAQQKGLMLLFPKAARVIARQKLENNELTLSEVAERVQLPLTTVEDMIDDDWDVFAEQLASF